MQKYFASFFQISAKLSLNISNYKIIFQIMRLLTKHIVRNILY